MTERLQNWWIALSARERWLVGIAGVLALISLAWLANALNKHGRHLKAGDLVLTGSVHPPAFLPGTGVAKTEFIDLGSTEITIK